MIRVNFKHIIIVLLLIGLWAYSITEPLYTPTAIITVHDRYIFPEVIAHKSLISDDFPGNSLSAVRQALASTIDGIEVDVRMSKDGVLFLYHGDTLEEYTDHNGIPESYNWSFLAEVKYKGMDEKLLLLDDFLDNIGYQKTIFLDIKSNDKVNTQMPRRIVDSIKKYHLQENVIVESFNPITLGLIRLYSRDIMLMYDFVDNAKALGEESQEQFDKIPWFLKQHWLQKQIRRVIRPDVLGPRFNFTPHLLQGFVEHGYPIITWTVDDPDVAKSLYEYGVKGLQSNKPQLIETVIKRKNKKISDAGGTTAIVQQIISVSEVADVQKSIREAKNQGRPINIGGRRHSMGGHTLSDQGIFLNMLPLNKVTYNPSTKTVTAQAGATWRKIQEILALHGRSIKVMQSDNIFTVGGSIGVNVHGWQVAASPIASTILSMTVITADGKIHKISPLVNQELFNAVTGGYGMFAVIIEAELETMPNSILKFQAFFADIKDFDRIFQEKINQNKQVELAYARLSVDEKNFLNEFGLFWFESEKPSAEKREIKSEKFTALKRGIFRLSEYHDLGKKLRWQAEKAYAKVLANSQQNLTRSEAMNTDIHVLWPLYGSNKDILHEYFIPKNKSYDFIKNLKTNILHHKINTLNVTIREVRRDTTSLLPYAKEDVYGFVCLFSQKLSIEDEEKMKNFTKSVIADVLKLGGTFYLPYRPHYTAAQILEAYPEIKDWINLKKQYDPDLIFQSQFFSHIDNIFMNIE